MELVYPGEVPRFDKYGCFVPDELVRKGFAYGVLDVEGMLERILSWPDAPGCDMLSLPGTNLSPI
jgi:ATP-dependent Lhr-like helicase